MTSDQLKEKISSRYNLICFKDLSCLCESPYSAYKILGDFHKTVFQPNDRLVFYSNEMPNSAFVDHLYCVTKTVDISNCFILLVAPGIQNVIKDHKTNNFDRFDCLNLSVSDSQILKNNYIISKTICPLPWMHLELNLNSEIRPCCINKKVVGNFEHESLKNGFYSSAMDQLRQDLYHNKQPDACSTCWTNEANGLQSHRKRFLQMFSKEFFSSWIHEPKIRSLDIKPNNVCNFKCRVCSAFSSSAHAAEEAKYSGKLIAKQNHSNTDKLFQQELPSLIENLNNIDFYGGEPFYTPEIIKFVKKCVNNNQSAHLRLHFNTNGSVFPDELKHHWLQFKAVDIQFSIDNIGEKFELERGGHWHAVEQNIQKFIDLGYNNMTFGIMPVISIMNVFYLDKIFAWAKSMNLPVYYIFLTNPVELSIYNITQDAKNALVNKYKNTDNDQIKELYNVIKDIKVDQSLSQKFNNKMKYFDKIRNQSFAESHPEIAKLMGYK